MRSGWMLCVGVTLWLIAGCGDKDTPGTPPQANQSKATSAVEAAPAAQAATSALPKGNPRALVPTFQ